MNVGILIIAGLLCSLSTVVSAQTVFVNSSPNANFSSCHTPMSGARTKIQTRSAVHSRHRKQVQMATLSDGTNYAHQTVLNASAKQLVVITTNSNYQKLGRS
jgi:hypothetical protein